MRPHRFVIGCVLPLVTVLALASPVSAASAQDQAAADVLFKDAKKLTAASDFEHACPKFAESQRLDPSSGTLLSVGNCYEKLGKLASAYGAFREAEVSARNSGDTGRQAEAARRAEALTPQLAKLAIVVPPTARVPGFEVKKDGTIVGEGQWGSSLPADAGHHEIVASAPGYKPWSTIVRIDTNGSSASVEVPPLEKRPDGAVTGSGGFAWSTQRTVGVVIGVVGLAGLGVGAGFAVKAASKNGDSLPHCQSADITKCDAAGVDLRNQAFDAAHVATGTFIAGAAVLATGVVVFLTAPSTASKKAEKPAGRVQLRPLAGPGFGGAVIQGVAW